MWVSNSRSSHYALPIEFQSPRRRQKCFIISVLFQRPHMWKKLFTYCIQWGTVSRDSIVVSGWWLTVCDGKGWDSWCTECTAQGKDFELILTVKMETRHPVEGHFDSEFPAICNHCGVMVAWSRKTWKFC